MYIFDIITFDFLWLIYRVNRLSLIHIFKSLFPQCELFGVDVQVKNALKTHYNVKALVTMNYIDDKDSIRQKIYHFKKKGLILKN